jgi:tetratricopeptide (TPR) repeat protein
MQILHRLDEFLFGLFPKAKESGNDTEVLKDEMTKFYTFGPYKPIVTFEDGWVKVEINTPVILSEESDFRKVVALAEKRNFTEAKSILRNLISKNKTNSEYYRINGQILSEEGDQEGAIDSLIDALRWDPKNAWALLMMGNIFAKYKDDIATAMKYYDQVLKVDSRNNIAMNNIGANLMQQGKTEAAKKYFQEALKINSNYANTYYALGLVAEVESDPFSAFDYAITTLKKSTNHKDALFQNAIALALSSAKKVAETGSGAKILSEYLHRLEFQCDTKIELVEDPSIPTAAKIELAENYGRSNHVVRYNPNKPAVVHLQMHELVHLSYVIEARRAEANLLFVTSQKLKAEFITGIDYSIRKLRKRGFPEESISGFCTTLFDGINLQIFNTPIDLFIEDFLYNQFKELRPYQFISLFGLLKQGLFAVTNKEIVEHAPPNVLWSSKIYNIVSAMQFKDLYGVPTAQDFHATSSELSKAKAFYSDFLQHKDSRKPGQEYEMVLDWAERLGLDKYFELIDEKEYRGEGTDIDKLLTSIEEDPYGVESRDIDKKRDEERFQKSQAEIGTNMAVVMFMVDALNYFRYMPKERIKEIAYEIALLGTQGFSPDKEGYKVNAIPEKIFSGYHILAFYYVSWKLAIPEMVSQLRLPYDGEFELAMKLQQK